MYGPRKNRGRRHVAGTKKRHGSMKGPWIFQFLPSLHRRIRIYRKTVT